MNYWHCTFYFFREVKNKETGLDISIPNYKETPGLLGSTVGFNVVVVSRLSFFKSPKHKENDVVQFMVRIGSFMLISLGRSFLSQHNFRVYRYFLG